MKTIKIFLIENLKATESFIDSIFNKENISEIMLCGFVLYSLFLMYHVVMLNIEMEDGREKIEDLEKQNLQLKQQVSVLIRRTV